MSYSIQCGDVMPGCTARFQAPTEAELFGQIAEHAKAVHGIDAITPDIAEAVRAVMVGPAVTSER